MASYKNRKNHRGKPRQTMKSLLKELQHDPPSRIKGLQDIARKDMQNEEKVFNRAVRGK
jgi:hypothetical protein